MRKKRLPVTTFSEIIDSTKAQIAKVKLLEDEGWEQISDAEAIFNGSLLMEAPDGTSHYVLPDGSVN